MTMQSIGAFGQGGFPGSTEKSVADHPILTTGGMTGDSQLRDEVNTSIVRKQGRRASQGRAEVTSVYTQVEEELRELLGDLRSEIRKSVPAKFMKAVQTRKQIKAELENMDSAGRAAFAKKYGVKQMAELAISLGVETSNGS